MVMKVALSQSPEPRSVRYDPNPQPIGRKSYEHSGCNPQYHSDASELYRLNLSYPRSPCRLHQPKGRSQYPGVRERCHVRSQHSRARRCSLPSRGRKLRRVSQDQALAQAVGADPSFRLFRILASTVTLGVAPSPERRLSFSRTS